ncbi:DUF6443 domain-containing protein, partial [Flavobacterium sp. T12S277]|uniref:DUF6443 domain-containing protein n=1 Tax=Flavobacterium sp. T12S277 TaxID=3402752 RepID=UPI003ADB73E5
MKKAIKLLLVLFPVMAIAQTTTQNYIKTTTYKQGFTETTIPLNPTPAQAAQNTTYFDGLGRPIQQVAGQQSNSGKDIITHIKYDSFGRQTEEYLPFKSVNTNMAFDPLAGTNVSSYYATPDPTLTGNPAMEATTNPYSKKELEASPLNRVFRQAAPGNDWSLGFGHEIKMDYQTNGAEEVKLFIANTSWDAGSGLYAISFLNNNTHYALNQLYKTVTYDENTAAVPTEANGSTVEFKNKEGQVVLKRTYGTVGAGTTNEKHDTYYVYDIYGNLTYVIPPKAVDLIGASTGIQADVTSSAVVTSGNSLSLTATNSIRLLPGFHAQTGSTFSAVIDTGTQGILDNLCYQYKYDYRNRLVEKKLPGKQWEFIVYDKLDRVVATGPVNSPFSDITSSGWIITKYDAFSRPIYTGWMNATAATAAGRTSLQAAQNNSALTTINESKQSSGTLDGIAAYYTNVVAPVSFKLLTVNYYDNYTFPTWGIAIPTTVEGQTTLTTNEVKGLTTASWTRVLTTSTSTAGETTATFYEPKARPVRTYTQNYLGGYTYTDSNLDPFSGQLKYSITRHKRTAADTELMTKEVFTYSPQDRLLTQTHQINNGAIEVLADNSYDELGQLITKKVGGNTQKIDYAYNIRGWLKEINKVDALTQGADPKDLFAFQINYNNPTAGGVALYNGNISQTHWKTVNSESVLRNYNYSYDKLNRLTAADFRNNTNAAQNSSYFEKLQYDKNGNIAFLHRSGDVVTQANLEWMDYMIYSYQGNQLTRVKEEGNNHFGFTTPIAQTNTANQYSYDLNGNMTADTNKNITAITYNHLNLPTQITFATTGNIVYIYNAAGQKVQKIVNETGRTAIKTDYLGGYQYDSSILKFFPTAEGYVEPSGSSYKYIYQY